MQACYINNKKYFFWVLSISLLLDTLQANGCLASQEIFGEVKGLVHNSYLLGVDTFREKEREGMRKEISDIFIYFVIQYNKK